MGIVTDLLQGLPANPALREKASLLDMKLADATQRAELAESRVAQLERENADLRQQVQALEQRLHEITVLSELDDSEIAILKTLSSSRDALSISRLASLARLSEEAVTYRIGRLASKKLVRAATFGGRDGTTYVIEQNGREELAMRGMI